SSKGRHTIGARHRTGDGKRPEPTQGVGTATGFVNAADCPSAAVDGVVRAVLVDPGAKAGRAHGERHQPAHALTTTVTSPVRRSFTATSLCGFRRLRNSADAIATALMSR